MNGFALFDEDGARLLPPIASKTNKWKYNNLLIKMKTLFSGKICIASEPDIFFMVRLTSTYIIRNSVLVLRCIPMLLFFACMDGYICPLLQRNWLSSNQNLSARPSFHLSGHFRFKIPSPFILTPPNLHFFFSFLLTEYHKPAARGATM